MKPSIFEELEWRGMVYDRIEGVPEILAKERVTVYNGFDVTADSLHVGHIVFVSGFDDLRLRSAAVRLSVVCIHAESVEFEAADSCRELRVV